MSSTQPGRGNCMTCGRAEDACDFSTYPSGNRQCIGSVVRAESRLRAELEARDAEHANERLELKSKLAKSIGALDVAREAFLDLGRTFHSGEHMTCCVQCGLPVTVCDGNTHQENCIGRRCRAATARIAQLLGEGTTK